MVSGQPNRHGFRLSGGRRENFFSYRFSDKIVLKMHGPRIGGTVLTLGIAMIVIPGPAILGIHPGLAILTMEFLWERNLLHKTKAYISRKRTDRAKLSLALVVGMVVGLYLSIFIASPLVLGCEANPLKIPERGTSEPFD